MINSTLEHHFFESKRTYTCLMRLHFVKGNNILYDLLIIVNNNGVQINKQMSVNVGIMC